MFYSIQHFFEKDISNLVQIKENFYQNPREVYEFIEGIHTEVLKLGRNLVEETLEELDGMLCTSGKRSQKWNIENTVRKSLLTTMGMIEYKKTCFEEKESGRHRYLLDEVMGIESHARMTEDVEVKILEEAVETSYEKAGSKAVRNEKISRQTVKNKIEKLEIPIEREKKEKKREVKYLYVEADEAHVALQYKEKRGDLKGKKYKGCELAKVVYVHEGGKKRGKKAARKELKHVHYFCGTYRGKERNEELWKEVEEYIGNTYEVEKIEKIYFQTDGGSWMKRGREIEKSEFVLDEFHLEKYKKKALYGIEEREKEEKQLEEWLKEKKKRKLKEWLKKRTEGEEERIRKKREEGIGYLINNIEGAGNRLKREEGVEGSSTEGHVSFVLAERMSSRPMGWSRKNVDQMSKLRAYVKNGGDMLSLLRKQRKKEEVLKEEVEEMLSCSQMIHSERKNKAGNGKWIEAIQAQLSPTIKMQYYFHQHVWGL